MEVIRGAVSGKGLKGSHKESVLFPFSLYELNGCVRVLNFRNFSPCHEVQGKPSQVMFPIGFIPDVTFMGAEGPAEFCSSNSEKGRYGEPEQGRSSMGEDPDADPPAFCPCGGSSLAAGLLESWGCSNSPKGRIPFLHSL